jgi:acetyltransferase
LTDLNAILRPRSVAVIGASRSSEKIGYILVKNMLNSAFRGKIYPVNPSTDEILGLRCYGHIQQIPDEIDLAVIAIPAPLVLETVEECGEKGVKAIIVISAGFKETGVEGAVLERKLLEVCRKFGMRMQGPNCLGVINAYAP